MIKPSQSIAFYVGVQNPTTGAAINADSTPTVVVYKNGAVDVAVTPTVTNPATGSYKVAFTVPSDYTGGDLVEVLATATVSSVTSPPMSVFYDSVDTARESETYARIGAPVGGVSISADIATVAGYIDTEITTLLSRLGAFTGSGVNTVFGFLKALMSKSASTPSDVGGTFSAATDSTEAIADAVAGLGVSSFPAGAIEFTYTVTNSVTSNPIDEVEVWISTDLAGTNIIWSGTTDAFGVARDINNNKPMLDAGTYFIWRSHSGYSFTNPDSETVS